MGIPEAFVVSIRRPSIWAHTNICIPSLADKRTSRCTSICIAKTGSPMILMGSKSASRPRSIPADGF